jgi:transcription elongation factor Elf1
MSDYDVPTKKIPRTKVFMSESQPVCPHCETKHEQWRKEASLLDNNNGRAKLVCRCCDKTFYCQSMMAFSFTTTDAEEGF